MRLNRYLASSGKCSRRQADEIIFSGRVAVNGVKQNSPGTQVTEEDRVTLDGKPVIPIQQKYYLVMNKPRGAVTTMDDPQGRLTVKDIVASFRPSLAHLKPVGRLDQETSGVLLFTNDGDLHYVLTHPSQMITKEYEVELFNPLPLTVLKKIRKGIKLFDGFIRPDHIDYLNVTSRAILRIRLHSGKNRIIRRIMEKAGAEIKILRRINFAGITNRGLPEGKIRELTPQEIMKIKELL